MQSAPKVYSGASAPVKSQPVAQITTAKKRFDARMRVVNDGEVSRGARLAYVLLDDYAGMKGECWPRQDTLAEKLTVSTRQVKRWIAELAAKKYITIVRTLHGNRYLLCFIQGTSVAPAQGTSVAPPKVPSSPPAIKEEPYVVEPGGGLPCTLCGGTGEREYEAVHMHYTRRWKGACGCRV